jgi:hypothetical protein
MIKERMMMMLKERKQPVLQPVTVPGTLEGHHSSVLPRQHWK